jgi:hypothetical protein
MEVISFIFSFFTFYYSISDPEKDFSLALCFMGPSRVQDSATSACSTLFHVDLSYFYFIYSSKFQN